MKLIVCIDDNYGVMFNNRRLSRDKSVLDKISEITEDAILWVSEYSSELFVDNIIVDNNCFKKCKGDEFIFVEDIFFDKYISKVSELTVFRWNRKYPSDVKFPFERVIEGMKLTFAEKFEGNSHPEITMEVYSK